MKRFLCFMLVVWALPNVGVAAPIPITSYDILDAVVSGGGWSHAYTGTITPTVVPWANYSGGSGTLNDGVLGELDASQYFYSTMHNPVITLNLGISSVVDQIEIFGGGVLNNNFPGRIQAMTVMIGGIALQYASEGFGPLMMWGGLQNDRVTISGGHVGVATDQIVLSEFVTTDNFTFSMTEISIYSDDAPIPEPSTLVLFGLGFLGLVGYVYRRHRRN